MIGSTCEHACWHTMLSCAEPTPHQEAAVHVAYIGCIRLNKSHGNSPHACVVLPHLAHVRGEVA